MPTTLLGWVFLLASAALTFWAGMLWERLRWNVTVRAANDAQQASVLLHSAYWAAREHFDAVAQRAIAGDPAAMVEMGPAAKAMFDAASGAAAGPEIPVVGVKVCAECGVYYGLPVHHMRHCRQHPANKAVWRRS